jgi:hypothetical protein
MFRGQQSFEQEYLSEVREAHYQRLVSCQALLQIMVLWHNRISYPETYQADVLSFINHLLTIIPLCRYLLFSRNSITR